MEKIENNRFYQLDIVNDRLVALEPQDIEERLARQEMVKNHSYSIRRQNESRY